MMKAYIFIYISMWATTAWARRISFDEEFGKSENKYDNTQPCFDGPKRIIEMADQGWVERQTKDPLFPHGRSSIGHDCKELSKSCDELNHWGSMRSVAEAHGTPFSIVNKQMEDDETSISCDHTYSGKPCIFPFRYNHKTYNKCVYRPEKGGHYCAVTEPDYHGSFDMGECECKEIKYGVHYTDIGQGSLGNCYFLSSLASIAYSHPDVIEGMFTSLNANRLLFTTKWFLAGSQTAVFVDDKLPVPRSSPTKPFFLKLSGTGEFWPIILEKTWAKIHGSYEAVDGGQWAEATMAMTGAPAWNYQFDEMDKEDVWTMLVSATAANFPMGSGTHQEKTAGGLQQTGLVEGHAYSVFEAFQRHHQRIVTVFNPWGDNRYKGVLAVNGGQTKTGRFDMTFDEYMSSFTDLTVLHLHPTYQHVWADLEFGKPETLTFTITRSKVFYVMLEWPSDRLMRNCDTHTHLATLIVAKKDKLGSPVVATSQIKSSIIVKVELGPGTYYTIAGVDLKPGVVSPSGQGKPVFRIYAGEKPDLYSLSAKPEDLSAQMLLPPQKNGRPCTTPWVPGRGFFEVNTRSGVMGTPTLTSPGVFAHFVPLDDAWYLVKEEHRQEVLTEGRSRYIIEFDRSAVQCRSTEDMLLELAPSERGTNCKTIMAPGFQIFTLQPHKTMRGLPTYDLDGSKFLYYDAKDEVWSKTSYSNWDKMSKGEGTWSSEEFKKEQLECTSGDGGLIPSEGHRPCPMLLFEGHGLYQLQSGATTVKGLPTYRSLYGDGSFAFLMKAKANTGLLWYIANDDQWDDVRNGNAFSAHKVETEKAACSDPERAFAKLAPVDEGGPCKMIVVPGEGIFTLEMGQRVGRLPTYWNGKQVLYTRGQGTWSLTTDKRWKDLLKGEEYSREDFSPGQLECSSGEASILPSDGDGPCPTLMLEGYGLYNLNTEAKVDGVSSYTSVFGDKFAYLDVGDQDWRVLEIEYLSAVVGGSRYSSWKVEKHQVKCSDAQRLWAQVEPPQRSSETCSKVFVPGEGVFELHSRDKVGGLPTYWRFTDLLYYSQSSGEWYLTSDEKYSDVRGGGTWSRAKFSRHDFKCTHGKEALPLVIHCSKVVSLSQFGTFQPSKRELANLPTFESIDGEYIMYYDQDKWKITYQKDWSRVIAGHLLRVGSVTPDQMSCSCQDYDVKGFGQRIPCGQAKRGEFGKGLTCQNGAKYQKIVQSFCPLACRMSICY